MSVGIRARFVTKGLILLQNKMNGGSASTGIAMEELVGNNYNYGSYVWKLIYRGKICGI